MKNRIKNIHALLAGSLIMTCFFTACHKINGDGPVITASGDASGFTRIDAGITGTVKFTPDSIYKIEISGQRNIIDLIELPVIEGTLRIRFKNHARPVSYKPIEIRIHAPGITGLTVSGSSDLQIEKPFHPDHLTLSIAGSGNIQTDTLVVAKHTGVSIAGSGSVFMSRLKTDTLQCGITGSGDIIVANGNATQEDLLISGSGAMDLSGVTALYAMIHTSGSGNIKVAVNQNLQATVTGSGNIYYRGNPKIKAGISGSGKIIPL